MQTGPFSNIPSVCKRVLSVSAQLSVFSHPPWKAALSDPYDLSLPCLGGASWNEAAAVLCCSGWKTQARFGRERQGPERNDGKRLDKTSEREYSSCKQRSRRVFVSCCTVLFTCLCLAFAQFSCSSTVPVPLDTVVRSRLKFECLCGLFFFAVWILQALDFAPRVESGTFN